MSVCEYKASYPSMTPNQFEIFFCVETPIHNSKHCKFHDEKYWKENPDDVLLEFAAKLQDASINNSKLSCIGYKLPAVALPNRITFYMDFANAEIENGNFCNITYENKVNFFNCKFTNASFSDSVFKDEVSFMSSTFENQANFYNTTLDEVDFTLVKFKDQVFFIDTKFTKTIKFSKDFPKNVEFDNSMFSQDVEFSGVTFHDRVSFTETKFLGEAKFSSCKFYNLAYFNKTEFAPVDFLGSTFDKVRFSESTFKGNCGFGQTKFVDVSFSNVVFEKQALFSGATFETLILFEVVFMDKLFFSFSQFFNHADFSRITFKDQCHFNRINFYKPERVFFNSDLSNASFLDTDISRVKFSDDVKWKDVSSLKIYEEDMLERYIKKMQKDKPKIKNKSLVDTKTKTDSSNEQSDFEKKFGMFTRTRLETIIAVYRYLRENYEYHLKYEDAGKFFIRERELKRNYREIPKDNGYYIVKKNWLSRNISFDGLYYHLAKYGESYDRPLGLASIIAISSIMFFWLHDLTNLKESGNYLLILQTLENATKRGLTSFFPLYQLENTELIDYLLRLAMFPTLGALFIALKRKLERRFRH